MTQITIIPDDNKVRIDDVVHFGVNMDGIKIFHAVQYNPESGGHLEYFDDALNITLNSDDDILEHTGISLDEFITRYNTAKGMIKSLSISIAGTGYSGNGSLSATGEGSNFEGTYSIKNGAVTEVAITNSGTGYTSSPQPTIVLTPASGSAGSGAVISATLLND